MKCCIFGGREGWGVTPSDGGWVLSLSYYLRRKITTLLKYLIGKVFSPLRATLLSDY